MRKTEELLRQLVDAFLEKMGMETSTPHRAELAASVEELFNLMLSQSGLAQGIFYCNFNLLVERFVTTLIQTLIGTPFAMPELGGGGVNFIARILTHSGVIAQSSVANAELAESNRNFLQNFFGSNKKQICVGTREFNVDSFPFDKWAKEIASAGINLDEREGGRVRSGSLVYELRENFQDVNWPRSSADERRGIIAKVIIDYIRENRNAPSVPTAASVDLSKIENLPLFGQLDKLNDEAKKIRNMQDERDMIEILNADIQILRDVTRNAVLKAIGLEHAFKSVITKNVNLIRENLEDNSGAGAENFREWIRRNAARLMPSKFDPQEQELRKNRIIILHEIEGLLDDLQIQRGRSR